MNDLTLSNKSTAPAGISAAAEVETQRAIAEVQSAIVLAKRFPRDVDVATSEIIRECQRPALAEVAVYQYARAGNDITGPSIRLAEVLSACWGNIQSGWRELDRRVIGGDWYAEIEAWAWDVERNRRESTVFRTKLVRDTKRGSYPLKDERDVYEHCANQAARRKRACILALIPGYIVDQAVEACEATLRETVTPETTKRMIEAFQAKFGVSVEQIEALIQRKVEAIQASQVVRLRNIFQSLKDGMGKVEDFFPSAEPPKQENPVPETTGGKGAAAVKEKLAAKKGATAAAEGNPPASPQNSSAEKTPQTVTASASAPESSLSEPQIVGTGQPLVGLDPASPEGDTTGYTTTTMNENGETVTRPATPEEIESTRILESVNAEIARQNTQASTAEDYDDGRMTPEEEARYAAMESQQLAAAAATPAGFDLSMFDLSTQAGTKVAATQMLDALGKASGQERDDLYEKWGGPILMLAISRHGLGMLRSRFATLGIKF